MQPLSKDEVDRIVDNNLVEEFDKLAATPGFVLKPMPFQQVTCFAFTSKKQDQYVHNLHHRFKSLQVRALCNRLVSLEGTHSTSGHTEASGPRHASPVQKA